MAAPSVTTPNCDVPAIWLEHKTALRNYIFKRIKDADITNDILQDVLLKVYSFCLKKSGVVNLKSWLYQIAHNTIIDYYRKNSVSTSSAQEVQVAGEEENSAFKEAIEYIEPLLNFLPKKYADPLRMSDLEGIKQAEIAKNLNLSLSATKSRIQRGRTLLKAEFITCCHIETDASGGLISFQIRDSCAPLQALQKKI